MLNPEGELRTHFRFQDGSMAEGTYDFPDVTRFPGRRPLAFLIPSAAMRDLAGNGPGYPVRDSLVAVSRALSDEGIATYRFADAGAPLSTARVVAHYRHSLEHARVNPECVVPVGFLDGADLIARFYYDLYGVRPPRACVLLSPRTSVIYLNNLTCPYLVLHGRSPEDFDRIEEAVHHHQMRYGDLTTHFWFPKLGKELGGPYLDTEALRQVRDWLKTALEHGIHGQEPAAA